MSFLIGVVLAFQGAAQLREFGAEIFVVDLIAISILRELGILLTAIIVAGRTASAYTAAIGSMKMREEIDAMRTLGIDPAMALVVPRVLALVITLPILGLIANIMGLIGGGLLSWVELGISPAMFATRLVTDTDTSHAFVGLSKAPVFAILIGIIGCQAGLGRQHAESLGRKTSSAVVAAIFARHPRRRALLDLLPGWACDRSEARHRGARPRNQFGTHVVHDGLDLDVWRGEILGVVGGSGTGKSVLLRSIAGLQRPAGGLDPDASAPTWTATEAERAVSPNALGRHVPGRRALLLAHRARERRGPDARQHRGARPRHARGAGPPQDLALGPALARRGQVPLRTLGRHAQARGPRPRPRARPRDRVPRRTDRRARPDRRRRLRRADPEPVPHARVDRLPRHPRPRHALRHLRPHRGALGKRVLATGTLDDMLEVDDPWVQEYFKGPRARAARDAIAAHPPKR
jgi:ABC transport permease subunit